MTELSLNPNISSYTKAQASVERADGLAASPSNAKAQFASVLTEHKAKQESAIVDSHKMEEAVARIQEYVQHSERRLDFRLDDNSGQTVIRVYDKQSEELIRQIPGELALKIAEHLSDDEPGMLFSAQV